MGADENLKVGVVVAGRYRIERALGKGGMATVYAVRHVHTGERLAMKLLRAAALDEARSVELFRREMRAPARIDSEHVVRVTDADVAPELGNTPFLVMELLRGQDLEREVAARGALGAPEVLLYLGQVARALDKAHKIGIVHRDLKPENLFLSRREDGTPWLKILDFGIAKMDASGSEGLGSIGTTAAGEVFGTPLYMAPEQARGQNDKVGPWTDIWALGVIAHKLLTGKDAWTPSSLAHLVSLVAFEPIEPPSARGLGLTPGFDAWFLRCCARGLDERFPSAGEAVAALGEALGASPADPTSLVRAAPEPEESDDGDAAAEGAATPRARALGLSSSPISHTGIEAPARARAGWALGAAAALALVAGAAVFAIRGPGRVELAAAAIPGVRPLAAAATAALPAIEPPASESPPVPPVGPPPSPPTATRAAPVGGTKPPATGPATTKTTRKKPPKGGDPRLDIRD
jgi:serine/threonine-protein kinase